MFRVNNCASEEARQATYLIDTAFQNNINNIIDLFKTCETNRLVMWVVYCQYHSILLYTYLTIIHFICERFIVQFIPREKENVF